jgi:peptidoglycan/LPS O-acetylase OafA/YrhL
MSRSAATRVRTNRTVIMSTNQSQPSRHVVELDGLRGIAILLVISFHYFLLNDSVRARDANPLLQLFQLGWIGVDVFFVLSGFLITGILLATKGAPRYYLNFMARRVLRIWPLYILTLLGLLYILPLVLGSVPSQLESMKAHQLWFWLFGANWLFASQGGFEQTAGGYYWSLAVEEQFYVFWPFVVLLLSNRAIVRTCVLLMGISLLSRLVLLKMGVSGSTLYVVTFARMEALAMGSAIAVISRDASGFDALRRWTGIAAVLGVATVLAVWLIDGGFYFWDKAMAAVGYTAIPLLGACALVRAVKPAPGGVYGRILRTPFLVTSGKYSYALYLFNVPIATVVHQAAFELLPPPSSPIAFGLRFAAFCVIAFAVAWVAAAISWRLIESRILTLKKHF